MVTSGVFVVFDIALVCSLLTSLVGIGMNCCCSLVTVMLAIVCRLAGVTRADAGGGLGGDGGGGREKEDESEDCLRLFPTPSISFESCSLSLESVDSFSLSLFFFVKPMSLVSLCLAERRPPSDH